MTDRPDITVIYQTYVETITANEHRRQNASTIYLSLVSALVAFSGSKYSIDPLYIVGPIALVAFIWMLTIRYFRHLAQAKFSIISEIENDWAVKPFSREWEVYKANKTWRVGLTQIEFLVPTLILIGASCYLVYRFILVILSFYC